MFTKRITDHINWLNRSETSTGIMAVGDQTLVTTYSLFGIPLYRRFVTSTNTGEITISKEEDNKQAGFKVR